MHFSLILTAVLCFTTRINLVQTTNGPVNNCPCSAFSSITVPHSKIKEYAIQKEGVCKFTAIVFETVNGRKICSNPKNRWAKHVIRQLEKRRNEKIFSPELEPTSTRAPSTATSLPGLEPTLSPSTKTSTSSTTPASAPSTKTLTSVSAKLTPNPTLASSSAQNNIAVASASRVARDGAPATSTKTTKASARRRQTTRRRRNKRRMKKWQRRCTKTTK